ncbi:MAG: hypothetical protein ACMXYD_03250 [Candidatus Woesearchaeota archaeon]
MQLTQKQLYTLWTVLILLLAAIFLSPFFFSETPSAPLTGHATATLGACINTPPTWLNPPECDNAFTEVAAECNVSAQHPRGISSYWLSVFSGNPEGNDLFNISSEGIITFNASFEQAGNYTLQITALDNSSCPLMNSTFVEYRVIANDAAPYFEGPIPNSTWQQNQILIPYNLNSFFTDPQGYPLSFHVSGNTEIAVTIHSSGEVTLRPATDFCGQEIITYTATNTALLSTESNEVTLNVECPSSTDTSTTTSSSGGGGGGGGGGAASSTCVELLHCYEWSHCQYTTAVSSTGDTKTLNITGVRGSQIYTLEEPLEEGEEVFYRGYQYRECIDTRACTDRTLVYARTCEYEPSCFDGIQNQDETGVDCGGVCGPCFTCEDEINNCGGPFCEPCHSCSDGIMNGLETGVDCGGPDCPPCATCFDGIQNQGEEGIDCGGPCAPCIETQEPALIATGVTRLLIGLFAALTALVAVLFTARNYVTKALASYLLRYQNKNRVFLLSTEQYKKLAARISRVQKAIASSERLQAQQTYAELIRDYLHEAVGVHKEASQEELTQALHERGVRAELQTILAEYFAEATSVEFSKQQRSKEYLQALLDEFERLLAQTSVLSVAQLRELEELPVAHEEIRAGEQGFYQQLSYAQQLLARKRLLLASKTYEELHALYEKLNTPSLHGFLNRYYLSLQLELFLQESFVYGRLLRKR